MFHIRLNQPTTILLMAAAAFLLCGVFSTQVFAQQTMTAQTARVQSSTAEVESLCNPKKVKSTSSRGKTTFTCEGKKPTSKHGSSNKIKATGGGGLRSDINCSYSESGGAMKWLGCTCAADEDSNCTGFITWCADQGDEVGGNSGNASCSPGG